MQQMKSLMVHPCYVLNQIFSAFEYLFRQANRLLTIPRTQSVTKTNSLCSILIQIEDRACT